MPRIFLVLLSLLTALVLASCAVNSTPTAGFTVDATAGTTDHLFAFDAATSSDPDGGTLVYAWDFGDGATAAGEAVEHSYAEPGSFKVELTVTDASGASDTFETTLTVSHGFAGLQGVTSEVALVAEALMMQIGNDPAMQALAAYPGLAVPMLLDDPMLDLGGFVPPLQIDALAPILTAAEGDWTLLRGEFEWNPLDAEWILLDPAVDDFIARWPFDLTSSHTATLILDWNAGGETVIVDGMGSTVEVPIAMQADLGIDGEAAGSLQLDFDWFDGAPCSGAIFETSRVGVSGTIGLVTPMAIEDVDVVITDGLVEDTLVSTGSVQLGPDGDSLKLSWDVMATGTIDRGVDCFATAVGIDAVHIDAMQLQRDEANGTTVIDMTVALTDLDPALGTGNVEDGTITVDDIATMTFEGSLADEDMDGVPDIDLTDADGETQTLAEFLAAILLGGM